MGFENLQAGYKRIVIFGAMIVAVSVQPSIAQQVSIDFGDQGSLTLRSIQLFGLVTLLSLAPGLAIMLTCFPFMVTVFSILRQAIGLQQAPPNMMIVSLALFLTYFVMEPVFRQAWTDGIEPLVAGTIEAEEAFKLAMNRPMFAGGSKVSMDGAYGKK
jgi:flagellar biosynthetic protein FliP